jgi:hypothetical protein
MKFLPSIPMVEACGYWSIECFSATVCQPLPAEKISEGWQRAPKQHETSNLFLNCSTALDERQVE